MLPNGLKQKDIKEKIKILREYIQSENSDDKLLSLNVYLLIKRNNTFDDSFFEHEDVMFNDIMEFIDIADELHDDLDNFSKKLCGIYLSCIKNCHIIETSPATPIGKKYLYVLYMLDFLTLSSIMKNLEFNIDETVYSESYEVIVNLANKISCFGVLLNDNLNDNSNNNINDNLEVSK